MSRSCTTCQHLKRSEIDRRLAAGEPAARLARDYEINASSLHRHRANCLKLAPSNAIKKEAARASAAVALLPSKETLSGAYFDLRDRIDQIVAQAQQEGSLKIALTGLSAVRQTLDSLARLVSQDRAAGDDGSAGGDQTKSEIDSKAIAERLIHEFDHEPEVKARIAKALADWDDDAGSAAAPSPAAVDAASAAAGVGANLVGVSAPPATSPAQPTAAALQQVRRPSPAPSNGLLPRAASPGSATPMALTPNGAVAATGGRRD